MRDAAEYNLLGRSFLQEDAEKAEKNRPRMNADQADGHRFELLLIYSDPRTSVQSVFFCGLFRILGGLYV
jgi:hypothetical protein